MDAVYVMLLTDGDNAVEVCVKQESVVEYKLVRNAVLDFLFNHGNTFAQGTLCIRATCSLQQAKVVIGNVRTSDESMHFLFLQQVRCHLKTCRSSLSMCRALQSQI